MHDSASSNPKGANVKMKLLLAAFAVAFVLFWICALLWEEPARASICTTTCQSAGGFQQCTTVCL